MAEFVERLKDHVAFVRLVRLLHADNTVDNNLVVLVKEPDSTVDLSGV